MNNLFLLAAVFTVAATGANAFPDSVLSQLFRRSLGGDRPRCSGDPSSDMIVCVASLEYLEHPMSGLQLENVDKAEQLDFVCNELQEASDCVENVHARCGRGDLMSELMSRTVVGTVSYMCSPENKQVILNEADCWENKQLERDIERCGEDIQVGPYGDPCSALDSVRSCMRNKVAAACSDQAARFIDGLVYHSLEPIANDLLGCRISLRATRSLWKMLPRSRK